ncbi:MAG: hypothetical protein Q8R60_09840 [Mycobacteriales bacterium]|nr:hypothetical protein [Mycobacteriales bacterium]
MTASPTSRPLRQPILARAVRALLRSDRVGDRNPDPDTERAVLTEPVLRRRRITGYAMFQRARYDYEGCRDPDDD